jgi:hypothetical protein
MFFNIGMSSSINFPVHLTHLGLCIDLDPGWTITSDFVSKGLNENKCTIYFRETHIEIDVGVNRAFPLFYNNENISNIIPYDTEYTDENDTGVINNQVQIKQPTQSIIFKSLGLADCELLDHLYDYLDTKIKTFNSDLPIKLFPTGGVDISLLISFILKHKIPYELLTAEYKAMDYFTCHNRNLIGRHWAYRDIHYWTSPSILLSGTHGDEMMLRNPQHAYIVGKLNGENILDTLKDHTSYYHSDYFLRKKHQHLYDKADQLMLTAEQANNFILKSNASDYQHWHLGETLTWTPLNDLKITNIFLNFSYQTLRGQILDAAVTKELIKRNNPKHLSLISPQKNINHFNHLYKIFEKTEELS